ncbi:MAG TPA: ABC transporter substrate-binding protein [Candidatus Binatia bacterium]|jgi:putative ABC transport system substrate-binding protein|nr:ABC transporter substrate-binding protein [Candidatus Binatia bacterium]
MRRRFILFALLFSCELLISGSRAAERSGPVRIGVLTEGFGPTSGAVGLRDGLKALGYREDKDFVIGVRFTQGDTSALPAAAKELVQRGVDILFTDGRSAAKAAQIETTKVPIVFAGGGDPVGLGLIQSFARPGGNITGVADLEIELGPKRLETFREMIPGLKRVLFPYNATDAYSVSEAKSYRDAARHLKIMLVENAVRTDDEAKAVLSKSKKSDIHGILSPRAMTSNIPGYVREAGSQSSMPTMFASTFFAENGGLASYTPDTYVSGRMAARFVDKILKGENPGDIPVEVNHKIELVINLKVAKASGIKIAPEALYRANRVIR